MGSGPSCLIHKMRRPPWMNSSLLQHSQTFGHQIVGVMWWNSLLRHVQFSIKHLKPLNGYLFIHGQIKLYVKVKVQNLGQDAQCSSFGPVTFPGVSRTISRFPHAGQQHPSWGQVLFKTPAHRFCWACGSWVRTCVTAVCAPWTSQRSLWAKVEGTSSAKWRRLDLLSGESPNEIWFMKINLGVKWQRRIQLI